MEIERATRPGGSFNFSGVLGADRSGVLADYVWVLEAGRDEILDALDGMQLGEWFIQMVAGDVFFLDEEFDEDRLVEGTALFVGAALVEFLRVLSSLRLDVPAAVCSWPRLTL